MDQYSAKHLYSCFCVRLNIFFFLPILSVSHLHQLSFSYVSNKNQLEVLWLIYDSEVQRKIGQGNVVVLYWILVGC